jgi:hypothetical protein
LVEEEDDEGEVEEEEEEENVAVVLAVIEVSEGWCCIRFRGSRRHELRHNNNAALLLFIR